MKFAGKTAVVTGGGSGIGRALVMKLAQAGASVWALDIHEEALAGLAEEASKIGRQIFTCQADVASLTSLRAAAEKIGAFDLWINNAGIAGHGDFIESGVEAFDRVLAINLGGVVNGTRVALETMEQAGAGTIVNVASVAGHLPAPYMTAYCASKHAVVGFTRSLRAELHLKASPVRVTLVSPGFVDTQIIAKGAELGFPEWLSFLLSTPDSVADSVLTAVRRRRKEVIPTLNGKVIRRLYSVMPETTVKSSRVLLMRSWKDLLTNRLSR